MLFPRWNLEKIKHFYEKDYFESYRLDSKPDVGISGIKKNAEEIINRFENNISSPKEYRRLLDLGAGSGFGIPFLKKFFPNVETFAIEGSPAARKIIKQNSFAKIIGGSFLDSQTASDYENNFDIIILRHVVQHFLYPMDDFKLVKKLLSEGGRAYISVPDMLNPRTNLRDYQNWWEYWFRSVHTFYYNQFTLFRTLWLNGLFVESWGLENEEIWCIVRQVSTNDLEYLFDYKTAYDSQKEVLNRLLK
jgi:SAM-dependent methyltransferase